MKRIIVSVFASIAFIAGSVSNTAQAEADWISFTMDNDTFVGNDNGYTNGLAVAWWNLPDGEEKAEPGFLAKLMMWTMPDNGNSFDLDVGVIGQIMITPDDIEEDPPVLPPDDLPYAGLLYYSDIFVRVYDDYSDAVGVTIGVVGEYSFAEESQEFVHELIDSDDPCCWDEQLDDEVVFRLSRSRFWKTWVSDSGNADLLFGLDGSLGNLETSAGAALMVRYGRQLKRSFATVALVNERAVNPVATQGSWYVFLGARAGYTERHIFLDESRSYGDDFDEIDYDDSTLGATAGVAYSWKEVSLSFAINTLDATDDFSDSDAADEYSEYGTFTLAWKLD